MEGLPLDVLLLVAVAVVGIVSLVAYIWRKLGSNQVGDASPGGAAEGAGGAGGGDAAPGRANHPGGECPICLAVEVASPVQTNCGHWFCSSCILGYYDGLGRVRIKCPLCRQDVTMLHPAAEDTPSPKAPTAAAAAAATSSNTATDGGTIAPTPPPPPPPRPTSLETQERITRFNERNSGKRRSPWQVAEDAPLLLRRLWADLRRGDTQVFAELIRRGVQLQLLVVALYILSPVDVMPESLLGIAGLVDDLVLAIVLLLHITTVYRTILLSWERSRASPAAAAAAASAVPPGQGSLANSPMGAGLAAVVAVAAGAAATCAGAGAGVAAAAAVATGAAAAAAASEAGSSSSSGARGGMPPPLARDW